MRIVLRDNTSCNTSSAAVGQLPDRECFQNETRFFAKLSVVIGIVFYFKRITLQAFFVTHTFSFMSIKTTLQN